MKASDIPAVFPKYWGLDADPSNIADVPTDSSGVPGEPSLDIGWGPETMIPIGAGGTPPKGQYENGIMRQVTRNIQWNANAGTPFVYDSGFSAAINGYPAGAVLQVAGSPGWFWISDVDDNTSDPDTGGANWTLFSPMPVYGIDTGTKNAAVVAFVPAPPNSNALIGRPLCIKKSANANDSSMTIDLGFGPVPVVLAGGGVLTGGELAASALFNGALDDSGNFELLGVAGAGATSRTRLSGNLNFYISTTGSDANDGLSTGSAFATRQHAWDNLIANYDLAGFNVTINVANGTYNDSFTAQGGPPGQTGPESITFLSTSNNPGSCVIAATGFSFNANGAQFSIQGFGVSSSTADTVNATNGGYIKILDAMRWNGNAGFNHISVGRASQISCNGTLQINGSAVSAFSFQTNGVINFGNSVTVSFGGTPNFSSAVFVGFDGAVCAPNHTQVSFSGPVSVGTKAFSISTNAVLDTGGLPSFIPGTTGSTATGGQAV